MVVQYKMINMVERNLFTNVKCKQKLVIIKIFNFMERMVEAKNT